MTKSTGDPNEKQFGLKPIEQQMIKTLQDSYFSQLSVFLSFVAVERLAYNVTSATQFRVEGDTLFIHNGLPKTDETEVSVK